MKLSHLIPITLLWLILSVSGCKDDGISVSVPEPGLYARIIDASGNPLADADVHYIFYTTTNPVLLNAMIQYNLASAQVVTLKVFDPFGHQVQTVLESQPQQAGSYRITVTPRVTNGIYTCKLQTGSTEQEIAFFIRTDDIAQLQQRTPLTKSDAKGEFYLSHSVMGIGRSFHVASGSGGVVADETIADSISVVLARPGYQTLVKSVRLDTTQATSTTFVMVN